MVEEWNGSNSGLYRGGVVDVGLVVDVGDVVVLGGVGVDGGCKGWVEEEGGSVDHIWSLGQKGK